MKSGKNKNIWVNGVLRPKLRSMALVLAALVVLTGVLTGCGKGSSNGSGSTSGSSADSIPSNATAFLAHESEFSDPVSTYYAEKAYEKAHASEGVDAGLMVNSDYIDRMSVAGANKVDGSESVFGFTMEQLPLNTEVCQKTSIDLFNNYTVKNLSQYMNDIAKNPGEKAINVIKTQFLNYCAGGDTVANSSTFNQQALDEAKKLMATADSIVNKYGSVANFNIEPATNDDNDTGKTQFGKIASTHARVDANKNNIGFTDSGVKLVIDVDVYNGSKVTHKVETVDNVQLSVSRQLIQGGTTANPTYAPSENISIGQVNG